MSTKTMRLPPRRVSMPTTTTSNSHVNNNSHIQKRKDRDGFDLKPPLPKSPRPAPVKPPPASSSNQLLAGYLAYEFLSRGTVLGQMWDPARSQPEKADEEAEEEEEGKHKRYVELANLVKTSRAHLPGTVNPSDLARLLQM